MLKKIYAFLFSLLLLIGILVGCGTGNETETNENKQEAQTEQTEPSSFPVTLKDATGEEVVIENKPERIVSLIPSNTEIVFQLGLGDEIVGVTDNDTYPEEVKEKESVGGMEFNVEKIISLQPDLVLGHGSAMGLSEAGFQQLRDAGIPVLTIQDATTFSEVYDSIEVIGKATGAVKKAEELVSDMKAKVKEVQGKVADVTEKKKVYIEIDPALYSVGKDSIMDEMLTMINAENMVKESGWPQLDQEAVIAGNPDVILITYGDYIENAVQQVLSREGWQDMNAIKNEQVVEVDSDKVTRPGPRLVEGVEELAKAVYPELFK